MSHGSKTSGRPPEWEGQLLVGTPLRLTSGTAFSQPCLPQASGDMQNMQSTATSPWVLCKRLASQGQLGLGPVQPGQTRSPSTRAPKSSVYLQLHRREEEAAEPLCHSQRRGPLSPTPQAGREHQETVHMTLKHRQDKVQFLKGRFI